MYAWKQIVQNNTLPIWKLKKQCLVYTKRYDWIVYLIRDPRGSAWKEWGLWTEAFALRLSVWNIPWLLLYIVDQLNLNSDTTRSWELLELFWYNSFHGHLFILCSLSVWRYTYKNVLVVFILFVVVLDGIMCACRNRFILR